jgi:hypothetical protein
MIVGLPVARRRMRGEALRVGGEPGEAWAPCCLLERAQRTALQVVVEERSRGLFDDPKLRFLVRVRRQVRCTE